MLPDGQDKDAVDPAVYLSLEFRAGSVLSKDTILKLEHFDPADRISIPGSLPAPQVCLFGAPNFRRAGTIHVYGVAQPDRSGLSTVLTMLPSPLFWCNSREEPMLYLAGRPFVLRERSSPFRNIEAFVGISGARLEQMEERLKLDVLEEARLNDGLIMVHKENDQQQLVPLLVAADDVKTSKEVFEELARTYKVKYARVPVSHGQSPFDSFIDDLFRLFSEMPIEMPVVFSCGMGIGRATFGMILGMMIRRWQMLRAGHPDPVQADQGSAFPDPSVTTLRLVYVLERSLGSALGESAVQWILHRRSLLDSLKAALQGDYKAIIDLTRALDGGARNKVVVDVIIDQCATCLNLREQILHYRLKGVTPTDDGSYLNLSLSYLERSYFDSTTTTSTTTPTTGGQSFGAWIRERDEIWNMFLQLRRHHNKLRAFRPIESLSLFGEDGVPSKPILQSPILLSGNEQAVLKERSGSILGPNNILKLDHWGTSVERIEGAPNFRRISPHFPVYATAQPTFHGLARIVEEVLEAFDEVVWINVREEPIVYINGDPYVLRDQWASLRNIKAYTGIAANRVEAMEERLREDVLEESRVYRGRILLHSEVLGSLIPIWEYLEGDGEGGGGGEREGELTVCSPKTVFSKHRRVFYYRVPVTAEESPEPKDFDLLCAVISRHADKKAAVVFNCQMGAGRSTTGAVIALQYLLRGQGRVDLPTPALLCSPSHSATLHYALVNSVLRGTRNGVQLKAHLDSLIDTAGEVVNLRNVVEQHRVKAHSVSDPKQKAAINRRSVAGLKRYCMLLLFEAYLNKEQLPGGSFTSWLRCHPEFKKLLADQDRRGCIETLLDSQAVGAEPAAEHGAPHTAALDDIVSVVRDGRNGSVLAPMTILKYDHFPGCQRLSLADRIEGAPNFRGFPLSEQHSVFGVAMPTDAAIPLILDRMQALQTAGGGERRKVVWFCLREEPVVYINGRPFVLRRVKDPISNLEMTGIASRRVESMEVRLKQDIEAESAERCTILLHEEADDPLNGGMMAVWEPVESLQTMAQVYCKYQQQVDYHRIPITDEQAPIPRVFDQLAKLIVRSVRDGPTDIVFNCQMGRGRTTTGMVIACLACSILCPDAPLLGPSATAPAHTPSPHPATSRESLLGGHYRIVDKLVAVLTVGRRAKVLADAAIDKCSHLQNLRTCIYDQLHSVDAADGKHKAVHYLIRYFYIIAFTGYLLENKHNLDEGRFEKWLEERREIRNLVRHTTTISLD